MNLFRVHAYVVEPRRTRSESEYEPSGGAIQIAAELRTALDDAEALLQRRKLDIDLVVDPSTRTCDVRDHLIDYAFGTTQTPVAAAKRLAERLASVMDDRSGECLLVLAARQDGDKREVSIWTFPREDAFQFKHSKKTPSIELLKDIFSKRSKLRKGAFFTGRDLQPDFVRGGALDFQASARKKLAADFWITDFLGARLAISSQAATKLLAKAIVNTHAELSTADERAQLFAGTVTIKTKPDIRWSLKSFADTFLDDNVGRIFLREAANLGSIPLGHNFSIDNAVIKATLNVRAFELESGVLVSAPITEVGESVIVNGRKLRVSGTIAAERMKGRK